VSKFKMLFMKACTVAVISYFSYPFLIKTGKEIGLFHEKLTGFFLYLIQGKEIIIAICSLVICLLGLFLILWIFRDDEEKIIEEKIIEEKQEKVEE